MDILALVPMFVMLVMAVTCLALALLYLKLERRCARLERDVGILIRQVTKLIYWETKDVGETAGGEADGGKTSAEAADAPVSIEATGGP